MLNNTFKTPAMAKPVSLEKANPINTPNSVSVSIVQEQDGWQSLDDEQPITNVNGNANNVSGNLSLPSIGGESYSDEITDAKNKTSSATINFSPEEYLRIISELNQNAENKHYVLFFGQPGAGKTWIIASILYYMKLYADGNAYLDSSKSSTHDLKMFYELQDYFAGSATAKEIARTSDQQYSQFSMSFTPKNSNKPPVEIVFIDASGEHSDLIIRDEHNSDSGKLPDYLNVILESKVNTKIAFVYDSFIQDQIGEPLQLNVLNEVFTQIQLIQRRENKVFPKCLMLSKADRIENEEAQTLKQAGGDATTFAKLKIPQFSNGFFNESEKNACILYKIGQITDGNLEQFDKDCPERFFNWLYKQSTGQEVIKKVSTLTKIKNWFIGA